MRHSILVALIFAASCVLALNKPVIASECDDANTTVEMVRCADKDLKSADKALNAAYQKGRSNLDEQGRKLLRDAQRAWIKFRDKECLYERDFARGGTIAPILELSCLESLTRQRTQALLTSSSPLQSVEAVVYWLAGREANGAFQCKQLQTAKAGLSPSYSVDTGKVRLDAHIQIANTTVVIPIDDESQHALCGTDLHLSTVDNKEGCAELRVDDGLCDAVYVTWQADQRRYLLHRAN